MTEIDPILERLAADALKKGMEIARREELRTPVLVMRTEDGRTVRLLLATPDVPPSEAMKVMLHAHRATHAAICFEGWMVEVDVAHEGPERDAWMRAALRNRRPSGMPTPSEHPDRYSGLTLLAQARDTPAVGAIHRQWRITEGSPRTLAEQDRGPWRDMPSNFWPMFVGEERLHRILARYRQMVPVVNRESRRR